MTSRSTGGEGGTRDNPLGLTKEQRIQSELNEWEEYVKERIASLPDVTMRAVDGKIVSGRIREIR
jgi:hypothetical protein